MTEAALADLFGGFAIGEGHSVLAGVDRIELASFGRILATGGVEFMTSTYTDAERDHCAGRVDRLATRFAAKEATSKALGTGFRGISPSEIEVGSEPSGKPELRLHGRALDRARAIGVTSIAVSLTHTLVAAEAFVVAAVAGHPRKETTP